MQKKFTLLSAAAMAVLCSAPVSAAGSVLGRISYIAPDSRSLILDGQKEYTLGSSVDAKRLQVAEFVKLTLGPDNQVKDVSPGPASLAG